MRYLLIISTILLFSCTKEEVVVVNNTNVSGLRHIVYGDVMVANGYRMSIYEDLGGGNFKNTTNHYYSNSELPNVFIDEISNPFYFYIELHNTSVYLDEGKGYIGVDVYYRDEKIITLIADSTIESTEYTSAIYNN